MKTRFEEEFIINHANTVKIMKYHIIYMQRLLNGLSIESWGHNSLINVTHYLNLTIFNNI